MKLIVSNGILIVCLYWLKYKSTFHLYYCLRHLVTSLIKMYFNFVLNNNKNLINLGTGLIKIKHF